MYYKCDLRDHVLSPEFFGTKFDVIFVDPPWEEYVHRALGITDHIEYWTFDEIMNLKIEAIADTPSFIFLWVGDGVGLEQGKARHANRRSWCLSCQEHCLMGIKGTVHRSTDGHIIHANIDTDIIIAEEPTDGSTKKPEDMYQIIEHFALGKRRLELFGEDHNIRPSWLTLGEGLSSSNHNKEAHIKNFSDKDGKVWQEGGGRNPPPEAAHLVVTTPEIEALQPKSPPQKNQQQQPMPPLGLGNSGNNRRNSSNSPQNSLAIMGPETTTPAHWNSSPMVGFGLACRSGVGGSRGKRHI
ncbi:N6-adenosine-methyltransferase subunit METTL14 [Rhynchospora pubera]|uniref:N6-adenosine-methyltransferase subunit METTL14 n=1 Tax=Rhynchospora pubera TaxID=906938 RepID=A0AAV8DUT1_9POAL|nr:N6-adenosine-methyltransferase subunit METTL14 [Rhynchospora pubera]